jgi:hypothetical protein
MERELSLETMRAFGTYTPFKTMGKNDPFLKKKNACDGSF